MDDMTTGWMGQHKLVNLEAASLNEAAILPAPSGVHLECGIGQITIHWDEVDNAFGYTVFRSETADGPFAWVDHHGGDTLTVVPGPLYVDTTLLPAKPYWYAVASVAAPGHPPGPMSEPTMGQALSAGVGHLAVTVNADRESPSLHPIWGMLGSEHLSFLLEEATLGGVAIGEDLHEALTMAATELGTVYIRAHGIFLDDLDIISNDEVRPFTFDTIDAIYDRLLALGLKPVVELSFMPKSLCENPEITVFTYRGHISKPVQWPQWGRLVSAFCQHLVDRYGLEMVREWGFEVWNEPNLEAFWHHSFEDYMTLYQVSVEAIKGVDRSLRVGGPATAASAWIAEFLDAAQKRHLPLDFLTTHLYGSLPPDLGPLLAHYGYPQTPIWWTEWGVTPTHFSSINDSVFAAPFVLHGMKHTQGRAEYLAYWVVSDQFEELGRPDRLFHGGFGLLTVGHLRKPRFWAIKLLNDLGPTMVHLEMVGDGALGLVDAVSSKRTDGVVDVLLWNGTMNQAQQHGAGLLDRVIDLTVRGLDASTYRAVLARVDEQHSNIRAAADPAMIWPNTEQWDHLRALNTLDEAVVAETSDTPNGVFILRLTLPMPGVARLRLEPTDAQT